MNLNKDEWRLVHYESDSAFLEPFYALAWVFLRASFYNSIMGLLYSASQHLKRFIDSAQIAGIRDFNYSLRFATGCYDTIKCNNSPHATSAIVLCWIFHLSIDFGAHS